MASLTCIIEPDELLGLSALVNLDRAANWAIRAPELTPRR